MLHTSPSYGRSSSAYSMGFPNLSQIMNNSNLLSPTSTTAFQFNSPFRSYLKTNEIKQRKVLHKTVVMKLNTIISSQNTQKVQRRSLQLNRKSSGYQCADKNQEQWESLRLRFEQEQFDKDVIYELFQEMLKQSSLIQTEKYQLPITTKQEFTRFKHQFIVVFLFDQQLMKIVMKLEQLRQPLLKTPSLYQEMKGYSVISEIVQQLYQNIIKDITLLPLLNGIDEKEFNKYAIQLMSNLLQSNQEQLWGQLCEYSEQHQLNHVHYTHFKLIFYKVLLQFNISQRGIRKSLKIIDSYKSAILRAKPMKEFINDKIINEIVVDSTCQEVTKKHLTLLFEYITNNNNRYIKKDDLIMLNLSPKIGETIVQVIKQSKPNHLLFQDFIQDVKSCLSQNYKVPERLISKFGKRISYVPFFATIFKENQIDYKKLVETEMDFITQNRTHFRKKELQLIHRRFNITNELFDAYVQTLQDVMGVYGPHLVNRLNHYRSWIVKSD